MEEIYRQYAKIVYHFLLVRCGDEALSEDLMQETFLAAFRSVERFDGSCKLSTWLCQIAKHLLYQHWEKNGKYRRAELDEKIEDSVCVENQVMAKLELEQVWETLEGLSEDMRNVVELRVLGDLSYREIGRIVGRSENWARVTFYRAKLILMREVGYGEDKL